MTEQTDGQLKETDAAAQPNAAASGQEETPSGVTREEFEGFRDELLGELRGFQSGKDKMVRSFNETQQLVLDTLAKAGTPLSDEQQEVLSRRVQEDDHITGLVKGIVAKALAEVQGKAPEQANPQLDSIFRKYGLEPDSQEAQSLARKHKGDAKEILFALETKPVQPISAAAVAQPSGGTPPSSKEGEALTPEYIEKMTAAAGNRSELKRIKEEYREKGVPVDYVTWS